MRTGRIGTALARISAAWQEHRAASAAIREIDDADPGIVTALAADCGVGAREFREVVRRGPGADGLLAGMMAAQGLDRRAVRAGAPAVLRDIEIACSRCTGKARCARELAAGTAAANADAFCPNARTFAALA